MSEKKTSCEYLPAIRRPLVTVITAVYNLVKSGRVETFHQCMASVHGQSYKEIEHIVIDGASTDGTLDILREYESKGMIRLFSEADKGVYDAFNKGIRLATGKYIVFMNSDDYWHHPHGMEMSVHLLEVSHGDFSYAPFMVINDEAGVVYEQRPDIGSFFCLCPTNHQATFCRTELLKEQGFDYENFRLAADYEVTTRLLLSGRKGVYVPLNFTSFRLGGISCNAELHKEEFTRVFRRYYGPIIGEEAANRLYEWIVPSTLLDSLASLVHPDVMELMRRSFTHISAGDEKLLKHKVHADVSIELIPKEECRVQDSSKEWKGLFGLPLLSIQQTETRLRCHLFSCIPLVTVRRSKRKGRQTSSVRLFDALPLWKRVRQGKFSEKHYLFSFIRVWSSKCA